MTTENNNTLPTNTDVAIARTLEFIKVITDAKITESQEKLIIQSLKYVADARNLDIINQINNLK